MSSDKDIRGALILADEEAIEVPTGMDRRAFLMRSALIGSVAVITGSAVAKAAGNIAPPRRPQLAQAGQKVVDQDKGPIDTTLDEFYKVGPGPSSSHTIGPMRITYDFYQRSTKLPADQLAKVTDIKVHLFGSLSATGKGHATERAALAGLLGEEPATIDTNFLDELAANPDKAYPVKLGDKTFELSTTKDIIYDAPKGDFPHPNTMTCKLLAGKDVVFEQEYYSVGGGFIQWKGWEEPKKGQPKYPYSSMKELEAHAEKNNLTIPQIVMANEVAVSGKTEAEINEFIDKILNVMMSIVETGLNAPTETLPGPIKLKTKAGEVYKRAMQDEYESKRAIGLLSAYALAGSEENARGHLVVTAPTGGSAGVLPAVAYILGKGGFKLPREKLREGLLAAAAIGYLCKHNATLSAAEGGCQAEIGVASAMGAAMGSAAHDRPTHVISNAAESSLEHHLGMTCDPVAGFVQIPCIERCAFGAVKAWVGALIAKNEVPTHHRVHFDQTVAAMAMTARDMNSKYKETSEAGLAVSVVLC
ncbi:MAG: L-serine ammonia-lyase [Alphaproteobacteria bacterium]|nr:L-serine ammonia-lyase [Alphaproteobacteria bacterium]